MFTGTTNHPHSSGWWYGGGRNLQELIRLENRHAAHANEQPSSSSYEDPFWEAAGGHGKSVFKKGQRSPHFNASRQAAYCLHGVVHSKSFPDLSSLGAGEAYPGFPGMTTAERRWDDCFSIEKPLVNARPSWADSGVDTARAAVYTCEPDPLTVPYIVPEDSDVGILRKSDHKIGPPRSKLAVAPYSYAAIPWSRYPEHRKEILARHCSRRSRSTRHSRRPPRPSNV